MSRHLRIIRICYSKPRPPARPPAIDTLPPPPDGRKTPSMPTLVLHNSMTRTRAPFVPIDPAHVRLYVCGPTVYDLAHVGNARGMVVFDVLVRLLRRLYPRVTYARNITDVDDKINARAAESNETHRRRHRPHHRPVPRRHGSPRHRPPRRRAPRHRPRARHGRHDRTPDRVRPRLPRPGPRPVRRRQLPQLRPPLGPLPRRAARRRPRRRRPLQARPRRLRPLEALPPGPAGLGQPLGPRPTRLAHRVLRHEPRIPRRHLRHPRRRRRPGLPPPRERARPKPLRRPRQRLRPRLDALGHGPERRREDVEVARQLHHHPRRPRPRPARGRPRPAAPRPVPLHPGVRPRRPGRGPRRAGPLLPRPPAHRPQPPAPPCPAP